MAPAKFLKLFFVVPYKMHVLCAIWSSGGVKNSNEFLGSSSYGCDAMIYVCDDNQPFGGFKIPFSSALSQVKIMLMIFTMKYVFKKFSTISK